MQINDLSKAADETMDIASNIVVRFTVVLVLYILLPYDYFKIICLLSIIFWIFFNLKWLLIVLSTLPRDALFIVRYVKLYTFLALCLKRKVTLHRRFDEIYRKNPQKVCYRFKDESWKFEDVQKYSNKVGNFMRYHGLCKGDIVAILMSNSPKYICTWLGLSKIGCTSALLNTALKKASLEHCLKQSKCCSIIVDEENMQSLMEMEDILYDSNIRCFVVCNNQNISPKWTPMDLDIISSSDIDFTPNISIHDPILYIYTSGTTGMPKAAIITHQRIMFMSSVIPIMTGMSLKDVLYDPLPLYHSNGGIIGAGQAILFGITVVIRPKFSASEYWTDCKKYDATCAQYIGEIGRYLLSQPRRPSDRDHKIRFVWGNGLRKEFWKTFHKRFGILSINEIYGSSEGNAGLINVRGATGSVGSILSIYPNIYPIKLIKVDKVSLKPLRDENGMCIICGPGEPGELVAKISEHAMRRFDGYVNKGETEKKVITGVQSKGDRYFRTGDILYRDQFWNFFFQDRIGDTFRWKGENISTTEVEGILSKIICGVECIVYGVDVPGCEGKACMAAIADPDQSVDLEELGLRLDEHLPSFAQPLFIRIVDELIHTSTLKYKKEHFKKLGFSIGDDCGEVYFRNPRQSATFKKLNFNLSIDLMNGRVTL